VKIVIKIPSQNPLFISIPTLEAKFDQSLLIALNDTDWLWRELSIDKNEEPNDHIRFQREWRRMQFYGLAEFFNEIGYYIAYLKAINSFSEIQANTVFFHGNNVILRMTACWDRIGRFLDNRFDLQLTEDVYFGTVIDELLRIKKFKKTERKYFIELKKLFSQDKELRRWRNNYIHNYGEYFEKEIENNLVSESFPLDPKSRELMRIKLMSLVEDSYPRLKLTMKLTSEIFDEFNPENKN
jgi:hypothetical protein